MSEGEIEKRMRGGNCGTNNTEREREREREQQAIKTQNAPPY